MVSLHQTQASWNREERDRINENWQRIMEGFSGVQRQISVLAGGEEVDDLLTRIEQALYDSETKVQEYINQVDTTVQQAIETNNTALQEALSTVSQTLQELTTAISAAETATTETNAAKEATIQATTDAQNAIEAMHLLINNFIPRGVFVMGTQYYQNNIVSDNQGNSYIALEDNINFGLTDKTKWMLFAKKGDRGEKGDPGAGLNIIGSLTDPSQLPETGTAGDAYTIDGNLWIWNGTTWEDVGNIRGEQGLSAYQVAINAGFEGTEEEWLTSLKGEQGATGPQGLPGKDADLTLVQQELDNHESRLETLESGSSVASTDVAGLNREVAYLKLRQDAADRIKGGTTFADDYSGDRFGIELTSTENVSIRYGKTILENIDQTIIKPSITTVVDPTNGRSITRASGRKVVQLDNGKIVAVTKGAQNYYVFVSKDGATWQLAYTSSVVASLQDVALESKGNVVFLAIAYSNNSLSMRSFDFTTDTMETSGIGINTGSYTILTTISLAFNQDKSILGLAVQGRRASRPNSSNIEYVSFGVSGLTASYLGYEEITTMNVTGFDYVYPALVFKDNGYPLIVCALVTSSTNAFDLMAFNRTITWSSTKITTINNGNATADTSITRDVYGNVHLVFDYVPYVGYAKTTPSQNGLEWIVSNQLIAGGINGTVSTNIKGNVFIVYRTTTGEPELRYVKLESGNLSPDNFSSYGWMGTGPLNPKTVGFSPFEMPLPITLINFGPTINIAGQFTKVNSITPALTGSMTYTIPSTSFVGLYLKIIGGITAEFSINGEAVTKEFLVDTEEYKVVTSISPAGPVTLKIDLSRTVTSGGENDAATRLLGGRS